MLYPALVVSAIDEVLEARLPELILPVGVDYWLPVEAFDSLSPF